MKFGIDRLVVLALAAVLTFGGIGEGKVYNPTRGAFTASITTTDDTETTIAQIPTKAGESYVIDYTLTWQVIGGVATFEQGGSSRYQRSIGQQSCALLFSYKNDGSHDFNRTSNSCSYDGVMFCPGVVCNGIDTGVDGDLITLKVQGETDITYRWDLSVKVRRTGAKPALLANGEAAGTDFQCTSGHEADGYCCNTACSANCSACSAALTGGTNGTCGFITTGTDPEDECTVAISGGDVCNAGSCVRSIALGTSCSIDVNCAEGGTTDKCADGVCCNSLCSGECRSCLAADTGGSNGTCDDITNASDPDNECFGVLDCDGAGACENAAQGEACGSDSDCNAQFCVDGVCCNTQCNTTCESCLAADTGGTTGTCDDITGSTDPYNECPLTLDCDGSGCESLPFAPGSVCSAMGAGCTWHSICNSAPDFGGTEICSEDGSDTTSPCSTNADCAMGEYCVTNDDLFSECGSGQSHCISACTEADAPIPNPQP